MYSEEFQERFWKKVDKTDSCWIWTGNKQSEGYGRTRINSDSNGPKKLAHRISLEIHLGRLIPQNIMVAHTPEVCHNRLCVNPAHLREATALENSFDRFIDDTTPKGTECKQTKLTITQVLAIREDIRVQRVIAEEYNITQSLVSSIKHRKCWAWVI